MLEGCRGKERLFRWLRIRLVFGACGSFMEVGDRPPSGIAREDRAPEAENALPGLDRDRTNMAAKSSWRRCCCRFAGILAAVYLEDDIRIVEVVGEEDLNQCTWYRSVRSGFSCVFLVLRFWSARRKIAKKDTS